jgi:hypothetical protein
MHWQSMCRWIYVGPIITLLALPAAVLGHSPWAALWLVTMCFLVRHLGCSRSSMHDQSCRAW